MDRTQISAIAHAEHPSMAPLSEVSVLEVIGELPDLATLVATCHEHGFEVVDGHVSNSEEWDRYEWSWVRSLTRWAVDHAESEDGAAALLAAREHLDEWLGGYRGLLGFVTLVLRG